MKYAWNKLKPNYKYNTNDYEGESVKTIAECAKIIKKRFRVTMGVVNEYFKQRKQDKGGNWRESYIRERKTRNVEYCSG